MQNAVALVKIASLLAFVGFGLAVEPARPDVLSAGATSVPAGMPPLALLGAAMIGTLWCFDGWYQACFCAGEIRDPGRNLVRGMVLGTVAIGVLYLVVNFVYLRALSPAEMAQAPRVGEAAAQVLLGSGAAQLMSAAVGVSILGCLASCILTGARAYLPMAQDGLFFQSLARVHPVHCTPGPSLAAQAAWSILLAFTGTYEQLGVYVIFAVFVFHAATGAAIFVLRRARPAMPRPYRAWLYPWTPLLFILTSLAFVVSTLWERPIESLWGMGIVLLGVPAFAWWRRNPQVVPAT
jgi:APA family basic amino acid/polyamine antiporter